MSEPACSAASLTAGEPLIGSAPHATAWVALEQAGAWGAKAFTDSALHTDTGSAFENRCLNRGIRPALIRRPGRHPKSSSEQPWVFVAWTHPDRPWLYQGQLESAEEIFTLDLDAIAEGIDDLPGFFEPVDHELLFVCTNGRRDTCCALRGRPAVEHASAAFPDRVWEITHLSGHRFAPTSVLLPSGNLHGRIDDAAALLVNADAGQLITTSWRGRSTWTPEGQAAEAAVRELAPELGINSLVVEDDPSQNFVVRADDGRAWNVAVTAETAGSCAQSCGKEPVPFVRYGAQVASAL